MRRVQRKFVDDAAILDAIITGTSGGRPVQSRPFTVVAWLRALICARRTWRTLASRGLIEAKSRVASTGRSHVLTDEEGSPLNDYLMARRCAARLRAFLRVACCRSSSYRKGIACLPESVSVCAGLRALGFTTAAVVVGLSDWSMWTPRTPTPAHSWVELDKEQITEGSEVRSSYRIIDRFPTDSSSN